MQKRTQSGRVKTFQMVSLAVAFIVGVLLMINSKTAKGQEQPTTPRDQNKELAMKIMGSFTFAGVGDMIDNHPVGDLAAPGFQDLSRVMRQADVTYANMEGPVIDYSTFTSPVAGQSRPREILGDLKALGIRIMTTSNNHTMDSGAPGVFETMRILDEAGIVHSGTGANLQEARAAHFLATPKGKIGVIGMYSVTTESGAATYKVGTSGGLPGFNPLHVHVATIVTAEQMQSLRKIRDAIYARRTEVPTPLTIPAAELADQNRVVLFNDAYKVGTEPGNLTYTIDPKDLADMMWSIRNGKEYSDFMVVAIHCHQNSYAFQAYSHDNDVPDFLVELAHKAIDNGADVFIAHGVHTLRGVEIYHGKPIFYDVSNFFNQLGSFSEAATPSGNRTEAERHAEELSNMTMDEDLEALLTTSHYEDGELTEVRLYPADLGQGNSRPQSDRGTPMTPSPDVARKILEKVQRISKPFGTTIDIENNIGVIHVAQTGTPYSHDVGKLQ